MERPRPAATRPAAMTLTSGLLFAGIVSAALVAAALFAAGGWSYYRTPLAARGYAPAHRLLRPAGRLGEMFGAAGSILMLATLLYVARKKIRRLRKVGSQKNWLETHIFFGVVGPVLITLHTAMKFNGVISIAYWSMVLVVLSGFVGRYLYVRVPKTIRGTELTLEELTARAGELAAELEAAKLPAPLAARLAELDRRVRPREDGSSLAGLLLGDHRLKARLREVRAEIRKLGVAPERCEEALSVMRERAILLRRIGTLHQTKKLFSLWHVFHKPLVYLMLAIAAIHVAVTLYLGYSPVPW